MRRPPDYPRRPASGPASRWSRRRLLQLGAGAAGIAPLTFAATRMGRRTAAGDEGVTVAVGVPSPPATLTPAPPIATPTATTIATPAATPTPSAPPRPLTVELDPPAIGTGEAMRVLATAGGAASGTLLFNGVEYPLSLLSAETLWGVIAAPVQARPGTLPLSVTVLNAAGGAIGSTTLQASIEAVDRPVQHLQATAEQVSVLTADAGAREEALRAQQFATSDSIPAWSGTFERPTPGQISTYFGQGRSINGGPVTGQHTGVDFADDHGTTVVAAAAGRVHWVGAMPIRGNSVVIDHGGGVKSGYHHLSAVYLEAGALVEGGDHLGRVGMTGFATGPHLHWEVTVWGTNVDPMSWLTTRFV